MARSEATLPSGDFQLPPSRISPQQLLSQPLTSFTAGLKRDRSVLDVYLHRQGGDAAIGGGVFGAQTIQSRPISSELELFMRDAIIELDRIIDLDFRFVDAVNDAEIRVYLDQEINVEGDSNVLGIALLNGSASNGWWETILAEPAFRGNQAYLRYAYLHEVGHTLGLEHPFDFSDGDGFGSSNPSLSAFPEDTVMAYRSPRDGVWPDGYSLNDLEALISQWGAEPQVFSDAADVISGMPYSEWFLAAGGDDRIAAGAGHDTIVAGQGDDQIFAGQGDDQIFAGQGDDQIFAGQGDDQIFAGAGNDTIRAGSGHDRIRSGSGDDRVWGGRGADAFWHSAGVDQIMDFNGWEGDVMVLEPGLGYSLSQQTDYLLLESNLGVTQLWGVALDRFDAAHWIVVG
jgi:serralysin